MSNKITEKLKAVPLWLWLGVFTLVPLVMILFYSVVEITDGAPHLTGEYIVRALTDKGTLYTFAYSFYLAILSTLACLLLGYPLAYAISKMNPSARDIAMVLLSLPMMLNFVIRTYAFLSLIEKGGVLSNILAIFGIKGGVLVGTDIGIVICMVYNFLPYLVMPIYTSISRIDNRLVEAAQDLGASGWKIMRKVIFPLTLPGVISGITMVFVPALTSFLIPKLVSNMNETIGMTIEAEFYQNTSETLVSNFGAALSLVLLVLVVLSMVLVNYVDRKYSYGGENA